MFNTIEIERFRGIKHASIEGFKQINLFFGKNNCGKSTLLESLFLSAGLSNPISFRNVNLIRDYYKGNSLDDFILNFYNLDITQPIHITVGDDEKRDLKINISEKNKTIISIENEMVDKLSTVTDMDYEVKFDFIVNNESFSTILQFDSAQPDKVTWERADAYEESLKCVYLSPKFSFQTSIEGLDNIINNNDANFIIESLKLIEPRVNNINPTNKGLFVDIGLDKFIPINVMGDGVRKIVSILTTIYNCKDGIVLIDEISNGFHYSVMSNLWKVVIDAAINNNTQLFITTHDYDSIKGLRDAALNNYNDNVATFKLLRTLDDELKALHYSLDSVDYSINQEIEIR
jgi:AAA15 family ATPase/GTPase